MEEARVSDCELTAVGYKWVLDSAPAGIRSVKPGYGLAFFYIEGPRGFEDSKFSTANSP